MYRRSKVTTVLRWALITCVWLLPAAAQSFPSRAAQTDSAGFYHLPTVLEDDYFDGRDPDEYARASRHMRTARLLGARYFRCAFSWNGIEPKRGEYQWRFWDHLVGEAEKNGITLLPYVGYTPEWAARSAKEFWRQPPR